MNIYELFNEFWDAYPKRAGVRDRHAARMLFEKIVQNGVDAKCVIEGARAYKMNLPAGFDPRFIMMPVNWLNKRLWEDYEPIDESKFFERYMRYKQREADKW